MKKHIFIELVFIFLLFTIELLAQMPADKTALPAAVADIVLSPSGEKANAVLREAEVKGYSGVALVAKDGEIILQKGYGMANRKARIPMSANTVVQIGSCTKDFTIVAILQLHERGLLNVKDPIAKYFKNVPEDKRSITIRNLLTQKSGLIDHIGGDFEPATKDSIVRGALSTQLLFALGSSRSYSNMAFNLLAAIIEDVSKQSFDAYVHDHICVPLQLHNTGFLMPGFDPKRIAHGYREGKDHGIMIDKPHAPDGPYWNLRGAGGMLSTVTDMLHFYLALWGDKILKPETRNLLFSPDQPSVFAGSDLIQYFFYNHEPAAGIDILLSSTSSEQKAPQVFERLRTALDMPDEKNARKVEISPNSAKKPPTPEAQARVDAYFHALASGNPEKFESMAKENFTPDLLAKRTADERKNIVQRIHEDFGSLTLSGAQMLNTTTVIFVIRGSTGLEGRVELTMETAPPHRIMSAAIKVGD